jgi:hypothetical protein
MASDHSQHFVTPAAAAVRRGECLHRFPHSDFVTSVQFHPKNDLLFLSGCFDKRLRVWSIPDGHVAAWATTPEMITSVCWSPSGDHALAGLFNGQVERAQFVDSPENPRERLQRPHCACVRRCSSGTRISRSRRTQPIHLVEHRWARASTSSSRRHRQLGCPPRNECNCDTTRRCVSSLGDRVHARARDCVAQYRSRQGTVVESSSTVERSQGSIGYPPVGAARPRRRRSSSCRPTTIACGSSKWRPSRKCDWPWTLLPLVGADGVSSCLSSVGLQVQRADE